MPKHISSIKTSDLGCTELEFHLNRGDHSTCKTWTADHKFYSTCKTWTADHEFYSTCKTWTADHEFYNFRKDVDCDFL